MTEAAELTVTPCWLCDGLGAVAVHIRLTEKIGKTIVVAHKPQSSSHPVRECPACQLVKIQVAMAQASARLLELAREPS